MKKADFIKEAKRRGLDMDEAKRKFLEIDSSGGFEDSTPVETTSNIEPSTTTEKAPEDSGIRAAYKSMFPRAGEKLEEGASLGKALPSIALDAASLPGRAIASLPALAPGGESYSEALARKKGKEGTGIKGAIGSIVRDPATLMSMTGGGAASGAIGKGVAQAGLKGLAGKVATGAGIGAVEGAISGATHGTEAVSEGEAAPMEALKGAALETGVSAVTGGALPAIGAGIAKTGGIVRDKATDLAQAAYKPTKSALKKGFDPENIYKYDLGGTFEQTLNKSAKKLNELDDQIDNILTKASNDIPDAKISPVKAIDNFIANVESGQIDDYFADEDMAIATAEKIKSAFEKRGMLNDIDLKQVREAKSLLGRKAYKSGVLKSEEGALKDRVGQDIYDALKIELESIVPEISEPNKAMSEIIPVKRAAEEAIDRFGNRNQIFSASNIGTALTGAVGSTLVDPTMAGIGTLGLLGAKTFLDRGRGAAVADITGKALQKIPESQAAGMSSTGLRAALRGLTDEQLQNYAKGKK